MLLVTFAETHGRCVYCGNPGTTRNHFIHLRHETTLERKQKNFEIPCCTRCNNVAGHRFFEHFLGGPEDEQPSKMKFMFNRVHKTADMEHLRRIAPIVMSAYKDFTTGWFDPRNRVGLCIVCGTHISAKRIQQYEWENTNHNERTCCVQHTKMRQYDKWRREEGYKEREESFDDILADAMKPKMSDLWRKG